MIHARSDYNRIQDPEGRIGADEPVFLMRAQDDGFPVLLRVAINFYRTQQAPAHVAKLEQHLERALEWRKTHPTKMADVPDDA
jgi:hypothetical protein